MPKVSFILTFFLGLLFSCEAVPEEPVPVLHDIISVDPSVSNTATDTFSTAFIHRYADSVLATGAAYLIDINDLSKPVPEANRFELPPAPIVPDISPHKLELLRKQAAHYEKYSPLLISFLKQHLTALVPNDNNLTYLNLGFRLIGDQMRSNPNRRYRLITNTDFLNDTEHDQEALMDFGLLLSLTTDSSLNCKLYLVNNSVDFQSHKDLEKLQPYPIYQETDLFRQPTLTSLNN